MGSNGTKQTARVRALVERLEGDSDALSVVVQLAELFAKRSRRRGKLSTS